jgi:hypothetical protein
MRESLRRIVQRWSTRRMLLIVNVSLLVVIAGLVTSHLLRQPGAFIMQLLMIAGASCAMWVSWIWSQRPRGGPQ